MSPLDVQYRKLCRAMFAISAVTLAVPAAAEPARELSEVEQALRDPATIQRVTRSIDGLADAMMNLKVGPFKAAIEGREPTPEERNLTLGELERRKGPQAEAELRAKIRSAGPAIAQGLNALAGALPAMGRAMEDIERAVDRATANMPDPTYPKR